MQSTLGGRITPEDHTCVSKILDILNIPVHAVQTPGMSASTSTSEDICYGIRDDRFKMSLPNEKEDLANRSEDSDEDIECLEEGMGPWRHRIVQVTWRWGEDYTYCLTA